MPFSQDDIAFAAYVEDHTAEFFDKFDAGIDRISANASDGFDRIDSSMRGTGIAAGLLGGAMAAFGPMLLDALAGAVRGFKEFASESINLRARADVLLTSMNLMGRTVGYTTEQLAAYEEELKSTGITTIAARQSVIRMMQAHIELAEASKLSRVAQDLAVVAGLNSSETFERLVLAIQKHDTEMLRGIGIDLQRADAYDAMATQLDKTSKGLTKAERQQAVLNAIYEDAATSAGMYEAAMGDVGKQVESLPRFIQEVQLALGAAFQPAYSAQVTFMTDSLKELQEWFDNNEEAVAEFGEALGTLTTVSLTALSELIKALISIPGLVEDAGVGIAKFLADIVAGQEGVEDVEESATHLGESFAQVMTWTSAALSLMVKQTVTGFKIMGLAVKEVIDGIHMDYEQLAIDHAEMTALIESSSPEGMRQSYNESFMAAGRLFGVIEDDAPQAAAAIDDLTNAVTTMAYAIESAERDVMALHAEMMHEIAMKAVAEVRRMQEQAMQQAWRMEDIERNHQARIASILQSATDSRTSAMENANNNRLSIVRDYHRRLRDMQNDFNFQADELARSRDAVGLLRLARNHKKKLEDEEQNRDDRLEDAQREFQREMRLMDDRIRKQLEGAETARRLQIEQMQRQLEREKELRNLHSQWEENDRQVKFNEKLAAMLEQFGLEEGFTSEHLQRLLELWGSYYGSSLQQAIDAQTQRAAIMNRLRTNIGSIQLGGSSAYELRNAGIIGQAGLVSRMLPAQSSMVQSGDFGRVPTVPSVAPARSTDRRELIVRVEGNALEPVIQRQLVASLLEIERNRA